MAIDDVTAGSIAGQITFQGLGSGTDFGAIVDKLVKLEQTRVTSLQTWQKSWQNKNTAFKALNTAMLTLRTTLSSMDTVSEFLTKSAATSNSTALSVTAGGTAEEGTHTFTVKQLAQTKMLVRTSGVSSLTQNINTTGGAANFVYTYKGVTISNAVPTSATLTDLVNIINSNPNNAGVRASTIYDGSKYYIQVRGLDTGAAATLTISAATTLTGFDAASFQTTQNNQDAMLKVDGWPASNAYISRATNSLSDVITGLTLNLKASGAGSITVSTDAEAVLENVRTFVNQVNVVRQKIIDLTKYDSTTKQGSILTGNYGLQIISSILNNVTANIGVGFDSKRDAYASLAPLGISTDATQGSTTEGLIVLDEDKFKAALEANPTAVGAIFAAYYQGDSDSADITPPTAVTGVTKAGAYAVTYTVAGGKITAATIDGHPAIFHSNASTITGTSGYDEAGLGVTVNNLTDGTYTHTAFLKLGKTGELYDSLGDLTNETTGPLSILQKNYTTISDNIQKKIDSENERIANLAKDLKDRFSRLDALLGTYSQLQTSLQGQIAKLSSSS